MLIDTGDQLIIPMGLTYEVLNTQCYAKVDDFKTLGYTERNYRLEGYAEEYKNNYKILFDFETITSEYKHAIFMLGLQR